MKMIWMLLWKPTDFFGRVLEVLPAPYTQMMVSIRVTSSITFKCSLIAQVVLLNECWKKCIRQKWDPMHPIITCHWFLGLLRFLWTSTQCYRVEISLWQSPDHPQHSQFVSHKSPCSSYYSVFFPSRWLHYTVSQRCRPPPPPWFEKQQSAQQTFLWALWDQLM